MDCIKRTEALGIIPLAGIVILLGSCNSKSSTKIAAEVVRSDSLVSIDVHDSRFQDLASYARDTLTHDGWAIKYLVKNDSLKYQDLYLRCSKGDKIHVHRLEDYLEYNRDFIPRYVAETNDDLVFSGRCASDCQSIVLFSKHGVQEPETLNNVRNFDPDLLQVVHILDSSYENESEIFSYSLVDIAHGKKYTRSLPHVCRGIFKPSCIDTVLFGKESTIIKSTLNLNLESDRIIHISQTIRL